MKDWVNVDLVCDKLNEMGIVFEDGFNGIIWCCK